MKKLMIDVMELPLASNVCNQRLREGWRSNEMSLAHVEMDPGNVSLPHRHHGFIEIYYILSGEGILSVGEENFSVKKDTVVEIPVGAVHFLANTGKENLCHLVICIPSFNPNDVEVLE